MNIAKYVESLSLDLGVQIKENLISRFSVTENYNRVAMVIGSSRVGVPNLPTLVYSPENFEDIFGKQDYSLERKGSFFHRTVKDILVEGPVLCLNLRSSDETKDFYNYYEISTDSSKQNSSLKKKPVTDFYDISQGFWKRSQTVLNNLNESDNLFLFTNQKERDISLLMIKSRVKGFDISVADYYNNEYPSYLHPKSYVSDYLIDVIAIEGNWTDYKQLALDKKYSKYFDINGVKSQYLAEFVNLPEIKLVKQWTGSMIPYFKDKSNNSFFIEDIINNDINETGILCAFNIEKYETDSINNSIDLLGENLYKTKNPNVDFLSYKRYLTDFLESSNQTLDIPGNCFGDYNINNHGRLTTNTECYIYGISAKNLILSSTSNYVIKPFNYYDNDAYYILNGKRINIPEISDTIMLEQILVNNTKIVYSFIATETGITTRLGLITKVDSATHYPVVDYTKEFVLCNYIFTCKNNNYESTSELIGLSIDGTYNYLDDISFVSTLKDTYTYNFNYTNAGYHKTMYLRHLESVFNAMLSLKTIFLNDLGEKIYPRFVDTINKTIVFDNNDYTTISHLMMYKNDTEFLDGNNTKPEYNYSKYPIIFKTNKGILGYQSFITENYTKGNINSGDPFFYMIGEYDISMIYDIVLNKHLLIFDYLIPGLERKEIIINNSSSNNGLYNTLEFINYNNNKYALEVAEPLNTAYNETISMYDAAHPYIIRIDEEGLHAVVEDWDGLPTIMYDKLKLKDNKSIWNKTIDISNIISSNTIIIDKNHNIRIGDFFVSDDNDKVFTRVIDIYKYDADNIVISTDLPINIINNQAKRVYPLYTWMTSYNFLYIPKYVCRAELLPDGSSDRLQEILDVLTDLTPYLLNDKFETRYIIDSYGAGLYPDSKKELAILAEKQKFCLALINMPSKQEFKKDGTKYTSNNVFDISLLISGGDKVNNYGSSYSPYRSSHSVVLTPYVTVFENGRHVKVPPASHIGQLFLKKHNENHRKINDAVAGLDYTIPTITGLDEVYSTDELNMFERYGVTAITKYLNTYYCFNNRTTLNNNSVMRFTHARESVIEYELSMYKELLGYQWSSRFDEMMKSINDISQYYLETDIISAYTNSIDMRYIDNQIVIVNSSIEINGKLQTLYLRMNILPTGYLSAS